MISENQIDDVQRATVYDNSGDKIGKAGQVYLDDATGSPSWITVNTGLFGNSESFVPLENARFDGTDRVDVAYGKSQVKDAPRVAADGHLEASEEAELYRYYGLSEGADTTGGADYGTTTGTTGGADYAETTRAPPMPPLTSAWTVTETVTWTAATRPSVATPRAPRRTTR
jgi:sporulation protein YlmC with PRC-barrel domain